ncbi:MAG: ATP-binding protein, partial [Selenomonadaceae bacterium]|nr:ATP-binding protein [Selenomonadaceae bacterium]
YSSATGNRAALTFRDLTDKRGDSDCVHALKNLQIPAALRDETLEEFPSVGLSRHDWKNLSYCGSWLSANELGLLAGLPQKEVVGLRLREEIEFGLNVEKIPAEYALELGHLVQSGEVKNIPVSLDKRDFDKHAFISGVTGSGKTTTCQNILAGWGDAFLVIEPAKTEYRSLKAHCPDLLFFTPGLPDAAPFFLNPFELFPGEKISSRADMLKATFEASFVMEAAIPQILEAAIYRAYEEKGWHIGSNTWNGGDPFSDGVYAFPTMSDFVKATQDITREQGFGERLQDEYLGSIKARLESLLVGAKGQMFNTSRSINFLSLVKRRVVIELEEIRSSSEKSLLMGFIMTNLLQAVKHWHSLQKDFRHITLIEEAHRLLSRYVPGDNLNKKQGVEVFTDMLAEVRKYGESLIIVDQIPDKMTPEILKNTNTKIIHKLFAQDDKDAVGNTMALNDEQKSFLSNLPPGRAVMFSQGWTKAIQLQVDEKISAERDEVDVPEIRQAALEYYLESKNLRRGVLRGIERINKVDKEILSNYLNLMQRGDLFLKTYQEYLKNSSAGQSNRADDVKKFADFAEKIREATKEFSEDLVFVYICANAYSETDDDREKTLRDVLNKIIADEKIT